MRNHAENEELCGIVRRTENCAISHSPHLNVASVARWFERRLDVFFGEDNSAISQPIKLKLSEMVDFTIAEVIYNIPCCLMT